MPWDGVGNFDPPAASFPEVNGTVIDANRYNPTILDLATGIETALTKNGQNAATANLPMGGFKLTGLGAGTGAAESVRVDQVEIAANPSVALSATGTDLAASYASLIELTGSSVTVTAFVTTATVGVRRKTRFAGVNTLTHSSALDLLSSANIATAANDIAEWISTASGWRMIGYQRKSGGPLLLALADGTAAAPALGFAADADTGLYRVGTNSLGLAAAGAQVAAFSSTSITLGARAVLATAALSSLTSAAPYGLEIGSGNSSGSGNSGSVIVQGGTSTGGNGGHVQILGGDGADDGGSITIRAGGSAGNNVGEDAGSVSIAGGTASTGISDHGSVEIRGYTSAPGIVLNGEEGGHLYHSLGGGTAPTIDSGGGTGVTITGTDTLFRVTLGTTPGTSFVVEFAVEWGMMPLCFVNYGDSNIAVRAEPAADGTRVTIRFASSPTAGETVEVMCLGLE